MAMGNGLVALHKYTVLTVLHCIHSCSDHPAKIQNVGGYQESKSSQTDAHFPYLDWDAWKMAGEPWLVPIIMSIFLHSNPRTEQDKSNFTISLATWNVWGLNAAEKWQQLGRDYANYHLTCHQETIVASSDNLELASGHKLVLIQQRTAKYRGLGFVIAP